MNKFFANGRGAYWIAIAAASLTFTAHAVQAARSTNETAKIPVESHASKSQSLSFHPLLTAAYRDGLYVGKLGAQRGEQRLAPVGRWAAQSALAFDQPPRIEAGDYRCVELRSGVSKTVEIGDRESSELAGVDESTCLKEPPHVRQIP